MPRRTLSRNVQALMQTHPELDTIAKIVAHGGGSNGTVGRIVKGDVSTRIDAVAQVARVFGLEAWQLLVPSFDADHPPALEMDSRRAELLAAELEHIVSRIKPKN